MLNDHKIMNEQVTDQAGIDAILAGVKDGSIPVDPTIPTNVEPEITPEPVPEQKDRWPLYCGLIGLVVGLVIGVSLFYWLCVPKPEVPSENPEESKLSSQQIITGSAAEIGYRLNSLGSYIVASLKVTGYVTKEGFLEPEITAIVLPDSRRARWFSFINPVMASSCINQELNKQQRMGPALIDIPVYGIDGKQAASVYCFILYQDERHDIQKQLTLFSVDPTTTKTIQDCIKQGWTIDTYIGSPLTTAGDKMYPSTMTAIEYIKTTHESPN